MSPPDRDHDSAFSRFEHAVLSVSRFANTNPVAKGLQQLYHRHIGNPWVTACTRNLLVVDGIERVARLVPPRGVLLCANHRSFFDQYVTMSVLYRAVPWARRVYFPVRSNFFYETWAGLALNLFVAGLAMYPPIYRQPSRTKRNRAALDEIAGLLAEPGVVVGMHPEGTRGKGSDPYTLLPAQPGVGQVVLSARPTVLPVFINGLENDFVKQIASNLRPERPGSEPILIVFGEPVELGPLLDGRLRPTLYKQVADRILGEIAALGVREKALRAELAARARRG